MVHRLSYMGIIAKTLSIAQPSSPERTSELRTIGSVPRLAAKDISPSSVSWHTSSPWAPGYLRSKSSCTEEAARLFIQVADKDWKKHIEKKEGEKAKYLESLRKDVGLSREKRWSNLPRNKHKRCSLKDILMF
ncbi:MAG: hypothetical protein L6R35_000139 [Caloplaca aegaea]|nr:MAG: hypothetical protein L6R35_000139 [Caloplaca aegaea]